MDRLSPGIPAPGLRRGARRIVANRAAIDAALDSGLSNALIESTNTKIWFLARIAFGFHGPEPLAALTMLALGGHLSRLPGNPADGLVTST